MQVYNDEHLYHFGIPGMHWGKRKVQELKTANNNYKVKINKIANSKSAHKVDVATAKAASESIHKRIGKNMTRAAVGTLVNDVLSGEISKYGSMSTKDIIKKVGDVAKSTATNLALEEIRARSVADKYNKNGDRIKGSNKSLLTREQVIEGGINTAMAVAPLVKTLGYMKMAQMHKEREAGKAAFERWGSRILTDKIVDYSHIVPNVNYSVK